MRWAVVVLAVVMGAGCGGSPKEGDRCQGDGTAACGGDQEMLVCVDGSLKPYPCRGPEGCIEGNGKVHCDTSANAAGDACPPEQEGKAQCTRADPQARLTCTGGTLVSESCGACVISNGMVYCQ